MKLATGTAALLLREEDLATLWEGQLFPPEALRTSDGESLRVVYRGRRGRGPGPDFLDAIIAMADGHLLQGDVELHLYASDFYSHGHHRDPAYDTLALHLVFWDDAGGEIHLSSGRAVATAALAPWVEE